YVNFQNGVVSYNEAGTNYYVRPVRGGDRTMISAAVCSAGTPYYQAGANTVADADTGLMWLQQDLSPVTWQQALALCEAGTWDGHDDWRLPNRNELQSLVLYNRYNPAVDPQKFSNTSAGGYWSSTTNTTDPSRAWYVNFQNGVVSYNSKTGTYYVRPVRDNDGYLAVLYPEGRGYALQGETITLRFISGKSIHWFAWDLDYDGYDDMYTYDNEISYAFDEPGEHIIRVKAVTWDGSRIISLVTVRVGEPGGITSNITFEPFAPENDTIPSRVMKGGNAVRYYRILDTASGLPLQGKLICFRFNGSADVICRDTDDQGYVQIISPAVENPGNFFVEITSESGGSVGFAAGNPPSFSINVEDRTFTESYGIFMGTNASVGKILGAKIGPVEFSALKAGIGAGKHVMTGFGYENKEDSADFFIENVLGSEFEAEIHAGLFGKVFKTKTLPEVEVGPSLSGSIGRDLSTVYEYPGFMDNGDIDGAQALAAGIILLESAINASTQMVVGMDTLLFGLVNKTLEHYGLDITVDSWGNAFSLAGQASLGAGLSLKNPLGLSGMAGSTWEFDFSALDGEYVYTFTSDFDDWGRSAFEQSVVTSLDMGSFSVSLGQKFGGDKRKKNTPRFFLGSIFSISPWIQKDGEQGTRIINYSNGSRYLEYYRLVESEDDNFLFFSTDTTRKYIHYYVTDIQVIDDLALKSDLAGEMADLGDGNFGLSLRPSTYSQFYTALFDTSAGPVSWEERTREQQLFDLDLEFEIGLGLYLGVGAQLKTWKQVEYISARGKMDNGAKYITALYEKDGYITDHIKGYDPFITAGVDAVRDMCASLTETIEAIIEAGQDAIAVIVETGAKLKAGAGDLIEGSILFLTKINPLQKSYQIKALSGLLSKGIDMANADTVGQVYIVNVKDENGDPVQMFPALLELTLGYTEGDLVAAGYTLADAESLRIYRWDGESGFYILMGGSVDTLESSVTAFINKPGQYLLAIDGAPPDIGDFAVSVGTRSPELSFIIMDSLSGIDTPTIEVRIDGTLVVSGSGWEEHYDINTGEFIYQVEEELVLGSHTLNVIALDHMGNLLNHTESFVINDLAPVIVHDPVLSAEADTPLVVSAMVTDDQDVETILLSFRAMTNEMPYQLIPMEINTGTGAYETSIPSAYLTGHGVRYFIRALDISGNISETDPVDIAVADLSGPVIPGSLTVTIINEQFKISWPMAADVDTAGYRLYWGETPDNMVGMGDLGLTGFTLLDISWDDHFAAVTAVDDFNNEGNMAGPIRVGRKADLDRDRDVDGNDISGVILKIQAGDTDVSVGDAAEGFGDQF
ncbi:MAG: DUF1566 domain-containing protein, partial [Desulfobacula sp.]|uniref:Lcl domain-containing protein n=1 Tax=Desulfobacula sp. TaxID=2593537 RepID=UPI0025BB5C57